MKFDNIEEFAKKLIQLYEDDKIDAHLDASFVENLIDCVCPDSSDYCQGVVTSGNYVAVFLPDKEQILITIEFKKKREKSRFVNYLYEWMEIHDYSDPVNLETIIAFYEFATGRVAQPVFKDRYVIITEDGAK